MSPDNDKIGELKKSDWNNIFVIVWHKKWGKQVVAQIRVIKTKKWWFDFYDDKT